MNNFIVKQVSGKDVKPNGSLRIFDFCKSKSWGSQDDWLRNKRDNGWSHKETQGYYTKFKLELIK